MAAAEAILSRLQGVRPHQGAGKWEAYCPAHDDRRQSLGVALGAEGRVLLCCQAGCTVESIVQTLGLSMSDLFADGAKSNGKPRIVATYDYRDETGLLRFQSVRYEPKDFRQRRPDGNGGWTWNIRGVQRVLYRLPELLQAPLEQPVFVVEGEKDVEALRRLGLTATTNAMGAGKWMKCYNEALRDRRVVLLPDNDDAGRKHMEDVAKQLHGIAASVVLVELPGPPPKGDVSDWLAAGGTKEQLLQLAEAAKNKPHERNGDTSPKQQAESSPWDDPLPLDTHPPVPSFPVADLPPWLARFVDAEATATQTPPDLSAMLSLAHAGAAIAGKVRVLVRDGWSEPTNIYTVTALLSGERKSAVFAATMGPAYEYEREMRAAMAPIIAAAKAERALLEARQKHLAGLCAREKDANKRNQLREELKQAARELSNHIAPEEPQIVCDEVTPEKLTQLIVRQDNRMLQAGPEGTPFEIAKGRYSESANFDVYLKGYSGDPLRSDRISRQREASDSPALSVALAVQPDIIRGLADEATLKTRGFLARFFYGVPASLVGNRRIAPPPVASAIAANFHKNMLALWHIAGTVDSNGKPAPAWIRFTSAADAVLRDFERWIEPRLAEGEDLPHLAGWANKLAGGIARIAAILHVTAAIDDSGTIPATINRETVEAAVRIGRDYLLPHALAAFGLMGADPRLGDAKRVLAWLPRFVNSVNCVKGVGVISKRDIHAHVLGSKYHTEEVDAIIDLLVKRGYLRLFLDPKREGPGRKPSPRYEIHPSVLSTDTPSHNSQNSRNREPGQEG
jgi:hypothetical protein